MKQLKALLGVGVVLAAFYVAFKVMPPYYFQLQFQDAVEEEARQQSYTTKSESEIRDIIYRKAVENNIPVAADQIQVRRTGSGVEISVDYVVHVDLPIYPLDLNFHAGSKNKPM
ncbi:MAG TPA: DUF4845 domain-containing protein [Terriglobales bacterium]|jgi:hypothetical protein|nr:DUF4845 domain-containing protein [Terriglobales bacterium]